MEALVVIAICIVVILALFYKLIRYENALIRISHYHGTSVEELVDIAYTARKGKDWSRG